MNTKMLTNFWDFLVKSVMNERGEVSLSGGDPGSGTPGDTGNSGELPKGDENSGGGSSVPGEFEGVEFPSDLDESVKYDPSIKPFISDDKKLNYANLIKSYVHAQKKIGEKGVSLPDQNSPDEDWSNFYNKLRPAELDKYEIKPKPIEGREIPEDALNDFKQHAHKLGLMPKQAEEVFNWYNQREAQVQNDFKANREAEYSKEVEKLKADWGEDFENQAMLARRAFEEFADPEVTEYLTKTGLDKDVNLIRLFNKIGKGLISEDTFKQESKGKFGYTREDAQKKYQDIMADFDGPYYNKSHPNHDRVVKEVAKLVEIAEGA